MRRIDYTTAAVTLVADGAAGAQLTLAGTSGPSPLTRTLPEGATVTVSAPSSVTSGSGTVVFQSWSDGGARTHEIVVPPGWTGVTARYVPAP